MCRNRPVEGGLRALAAQTKVFALLDAYREFYWGYNMLPLVIHIATRCGCCWAGGNIWPPATQAKAFVPQMAYSGFYLGYGVLP